TEAERRRNRISRKAIVSRMRKLSKSTLTCAYYFERCFHNAVEQHRAYQVFNASSGYAISCDMMSACDLSQIERDLNDSTRINDHI
ncbi:hypothetical protein PFISCL1PPCAC_1175, partial [Pristionchus fissidentatus]